MTPARRPPHGHAAGPWYRRLTQPLPGLMTTLVVALAPAAPSFAATTPSPAAAASATPAAAPTAPTPAAAPAAPAAPDAARQIDAAALSQPPKQTHFSPAVYPPAAAAAGLTADVILLLDIDATGQVTGVALAEPSQHPGMGFEEAAQEAAWNFAFTPAQLGAQPIAVQISYRYRFTLSAAAPPPGAAAGASAATPTPSTLVNLRGKLRERGTRKLLPGVVVTVYQEASSTTAASAFEATTNATGDFSFVALPPGVWQLVVESDGHRIFRTSEVVEAGQLTEVTLFLERLSYNPFDVVVTADKPRKEVSRINLPAAAIEKVPGTQGDALGIIQNLPSVARAPAFSGAIIVRGAAPEDTRIFVDGIEVPIAYHFGGLRSVVPTGLLQGIDFYAGNFPSTYGRATGGIVDIQTKRTRPEQTHGYVDINLLDSGFFLEAPLGSQGSVAVAARRSYVDLVLEALLPKDSNFNLIVAPRYYDYQVLGTYRPSPAHDVRALLFGSDDALSLLFDNPADVSAQASGNRLSTTTGFKRLMVSDRYVPNTSFENTLSLAVGRDAVAFGLGKINFDLSFYSTQLRNVTRYRLSEQLAVTAGIDSLLTSADARITLPRPPREGAPASGGLLDADKALSVDIAGQNTLMPGGSCDVEWTPSAPWLISAGLRLDHYPRVSSFKADPRFTVRHRLQPNLTLKSGAGIYHQEPEFYETDPTFGSPGLQPKKALHTSLGAEWRLQPHLLLDVTGFYKRLDALVSAAPAAAATAYVSRGSGRVYGFDLLLRHDFFHNFFGWLAYTLSRAERRDVGDSAYRLFDYDQTHILTAVGTYRLPGNWEVGLRWRLVSGRPTSPVIGAIFVADQDRYDAIYGRTNSTRLAAFHQLDVRVDKRWVFEKWILSAYVDILNTYNRANPEDINYSYNYRDSSVMQGLPIFAVLGLRAEM